MMHDSKVLFGSPRPWIVKSSESVDDVAINNLSHVLDKRGRVCAYIGSIGYPWGIQTDIQEMNN